VKRAEEMRVGPETTYSDICSMLDQLNQLQSATDDKCGDKPQSVQSLVDRMNNTLSKLPSDSQIHSQWAKARDQYQQVIALIKLRRSELTESHTRLAADDKDFRLRTETPPLRGSSRRSNVRPQSYAGNYLPPVCHVKPTPISTEATAAVKSK